MDLSLSFLLSDRPGAAIMSSLECNVDGSGKVRLFDVVILVYSTQDSQNISKRFHTIVIEM